MVSRAPIAVLKRRVFVLDDPPLWLYLWPFLFMPLLGAGGVLSY